MLDMHEVNERDFLKVKAKVVWEWMVDEALDYKRVQDIR
jgi:hypothetical protein